MDGARVFDSEPDLRELLQAVPADRLAASLGELLGERFSLTDLQGSTVLGTGPEGSARRVPLRFDFDVLGYLYCADANDAHLQAAAGLVELLLRSAARYRMAAHLHEAAIDEDYRELQREHARLAESEARYRDLAASLEARVQEQVAAIDAARRQLYQAEKMAAVGQLAAGMAHEINNPVGFIRSNLNTGLAYLAELAALAPLVRNGDVQALRARWQERDLDYVLEDFAGLLDECRAGADRVAGIVAALKDFSSVDEEGRRPMDLNQSIPAVCTVAASRLGAGTEIALDLGPLPPVSCDAGQINQVFLNLLLNAAQAVGEGGRIDIRSRRDGDTVRIGFADNGAGIAAEVLPRIFDPFFTTRDVGQGTGLGLTVSLDIVRAHGGHIEVQSEPGAGSTFTVVLPLEPAR